ncbi:Hypothetical_protein [Hexamita inflata]|uniref:Hypothetical_protein n=1 Tax=Hexamita inflata TaxID=28002 RepID=A0ABP1HSX8_9EUKA
MNQIWSNLVQICQKNQENWGIPSSYLQLLGVYQNLPVVLRVTFAGKCQALIFTLVLAENAKKCSRKRVRLPQVGAVEGYLSRDFTVQSNQNLLNCFAILFKLPINSQQIEFEQLYIAANTICLTSFECYLYCQKFLTILSNIRFNSSLFKSIIELFYGSKKNEFNSQFNQCQEAIQTIHYLICQEAIQTIHYLI